MKIDNVDVKTFNNVKGIIAHDNIRVYASDYEKEASNAILSNLFIEKDWKATIPTPEGHYLNKYTETF